MIVGDNRLHDNVNLIFLQVSGREENLREHTPLEEER